MRTTTKLALGLAVVSAAALAPIKGKAQGYDACTSKQCSGQSDCTGLGNNCICFPNPFLIPLTCSHFN